MWGARTKMWGAQNQGRTNLGALKPQFGPDSKGSFQFYQSSDTLRLNPSTQQLFLYSQQVYQCEISGLTEKLELLSFQTLCVFFFLWTHSSGKEKKLICFPRYFVVTSPKDLAYCRHSGSISSRFGAPVVYPPPNYERRLSKRLEIDPNNRP